MRISMRRATRIETKNWFYGDYGADGVQVLSGQEVRAIKLARYS